MKNSIEYAIFKRPEAHGGFWQAIAGGGKNGETYLEAAKRETFEESGIAIDADFIQLNSMVTIPVVNITGDFFWGEAVPVIPEYSFGVNATGQEIKISEEHVEFCWVMYERARELLKWDSNMNALWELDWRLRNIYRF